MRRKKLLFSVVFAALASPGLHAQVLDADTLASGSETVRAWYSFERRETIETAIDADLELDHLLEEARERISDALDEESKDCDVPGDESGRRACEFTSNLSAYEAFLLADQACRIGSALDDITDPSSSVESVRSAATAASETLGNSTLAGLDLFGPEWFGSKSTFQLFGENRVPAACAGSDDLHVTTIVIPGTSVADTDKLVLAYSLALSYKAWEHNRPNVEVTAELIRQANERWLQFETNVIHDQYPWETLLFNDWLAGASPRFRGTLTHPPTQQLRALHPLPTAVLDVGGSDTLFRPRLSVEVLGLRHLNKTDYTPKSAVSVIATLGAEADESTGWGLLYTWKRGSVGVIYQDTAVDDDVIGLVFGIDLANQVNSRRNDLMDEWRNLRTRLEGQEERLP